MFINFRPDIPDRYLYIEDIIEKGFDVAIFCYSDVSSDSAGWDGLCDFFYAEEQKTQTAFGKLSIWSYMAQRVMDYLQTLDFVDKKNIAVMGHSRLGKCALLTAAFDERFSFACMNQLGCCGASISRGKGGETIAGITERFGYWFCGNLKKYSHNEFFMPFDQHFLLALVAPRKVCIGTAELDTWADTDYQLLNCIAADEIYKLYGSTGYIGEYVPCNPETYYTTGDLAFFNRTGTHFMSIRDWRVYMDYILTHKNG